MKKLIVVLFLIGGIFMISPMDAFLKNTAENIVHRKNLTTGIVKVVNANKSFDVEIGNCGKICKGIFTLSPNPDLAVEDKVRVGYLKGNKEDPILFAPTKSLVTIVRRYALIVAYPNELRVFDMDGNLINQIAITGWSYAGCGITIDSQGNIYVEEDGETIKKYDSNLNLLATQNIEDVQNWISGINMGSDGYLYTLESIASGYDVKRRYTSDLTIKDIIPITSDVFDSHDGAPCLDLNGNIYIVGDNHDICKYSSTGVKLASIDVGYVGNQWAGCVVLGNYVYFAKYTDTIIYLPLNLSTYTEWDLSLLPEDSQCYAITVADNHLIFAGWDTGNHAAVWKYDSNRNLIWYKQLPDSTYGYKAGGYNF